MVITTDALNALLCIAPPATCVDRLGELSLAAFERRVGAQVVAKLADLGLAQVNAGAVSAPLSVVTFYERWSPRTSLMRDTMMDGGAAYRAVVSITERGWEAIMAAIVDGRVTLPKPEWADADK